MSEQTMTLPDLGEGLTEAEIVRWLVAEGDEVTVDQPVVEVETAKAAVEVPIPFAGRVIGLHGRAGQSLAVGEPLITVESGSGRVLVGSGTSAPAHTGRRLRPRNTASRPVAAPSTPTAEASTAAPTTARGAPPTTTRAAPLVASPVVRRLARERGIDLARVDGTGAGGIVTRGDVERASTSPESRTALSSFQRSAAATFARSRAEIPEATVWVDVDATALVKLRESGRTADNPGPGLLAYLAGFVVAALREYPMFNARFDAQRQEIVESTAVNLGIAAQGSKGLVVPVVLGAEAMSISTLDEQIDQATARARQGSVTPAELAAGTFTLNNYGSLRVDGSAAIINYPQVAILGVGRILDRPWVVRGRIRPRKIAQLSFVFDHRVGDGVTAAGFLRAVADAIENPVRALAQR